jgi:methionyl-tRNA formyltransferase
LRTIFLGTSEFAAAVLSRLAESEAHRPVLVLSRPDRPRGRGRKLAAPPVAERARALGIALKQPEKINDPATRELIAGAFDRSASHRQPSRPGSRAPGPAAATAPRATSGASDVAEAMGTVVVCAFGALISEPLLSEHELLNVHPSLLPRWRGAAPIERAIMAGDRETGVSIMRVTAGLDSGPVLLAAREPIEPGDTYGSLAERLSRLGGELLLRVLDQKAVGAAPAAVEQREREATYATKIDASDRLLDPAMTAQELERVVRALQPHIGARVALADGTALGVCRVAFAGSGVAQTQTDVSPGGRGVMERDGRLLLACARGVLELLEVRPAGGRAMDAASFLLGHGVPSPAA